MDESSTREPRTRDRYRPSIWLEGVIAERKKEAAKSARRRLENPSVVRWLPAESGAALHGAHGSGSRPVEGVLCIVRHASFQISCPRWASVYRQQPALIAPCLLAAHGRRIREARRSYQA